jgi:hypothetical protein
MKFLKKIQNLPERKRKLVFWTVLSVIAIGLITWYAFNARQIIGNL